MTHDPIFFCTICGHAAKNPYLSLDRRVEKVSVTTNGGKPVTLTNIENCQTMFIYCTHGCWNAHQHAIISELRLKTTYPPFGLVTPCCRCGATVNRTQTYVNYAITETILEHTEPILTGRCIDDKDFAVLCHACEDPDLPETSQSEKINYGQRAIA